MVYQVVVCWFGIGRGGEVYSASFIGELVTELEKRRSSGSELGFTSLFDVFVRSRQPDKGRMEVCSPSLSILPLFKKKRRTFDISFYSFY
jgi:hypothetical protein